MARLKATPAIPDPTPAELHHAGLSLATRLRDEIRQYEARYELRSVDLEAALKRGDIRETAEVAQWVIAYRTLRGLTDERQARR